LLKTGAKITVINWYYTTLQDIIFLRKGLGMLFEIKSCSTFAAYFSTNKRRLKSMSGNRTFTMIKPDAVRAGNIGNILQMINEAGFRIVAMKLTKLSMEKAGEFYEVHKERPFYGELCEFMSSGPIVAAILEKENAVEDFRNLIGATNPANAAPGTIRAKYATSVGENAVHGSDSDENAAIESAFHFGGVEMF
jgi:nucleoside-diphosphate kinase